ncbi:hypothetical protein DD985_23725 [Pseudomonas sp. HMWF011]|nr:hypothetical protein C7A09_21385 [Pseudomonas fluorescens]PTT07097.1 hypothetical protein DBR14_27975 [Pseudomonas sp. HMWF034]PVV65815.1 hypothetical protein DD985_23725 [Pseudomonas sp. HMWF011]TKK42097.1 hypothetical protein PflCFBP13517_06115 [Pseudomonas fluorescens]
MMIVPTLCVGIHPVTLRVTLCRWDAERPGRHSHAERGNDQCRRGLIGRVATTASAGDNHPSPAAPGCCW